MVSDDEEPVALFDVPELLLSPATVGRSEAGLQRALRAAADDGTVIPVDAGLVGVALVGARALDQAERIADPKARAYAVAALLSPQREVLQALRLPAAVAPADQPRPTAGSGGDTPDWARDLFGTAAAG